MGDTVSFCYAGKYEATWLQDIRISSHLHAGTELVLVTKGECRSAFSTGEELTATEGMLFVIPPEIRHDQSGRCMTLYMELDIPDDEIPAHVSVINLRDDEYVSTWMQSLLHLTEHGHPPEAHFLAAAIWARLSAHLRAPQTILPLYVDRAHEFILSNYHRYELQARDIAKAAGCSVSHLDSLFRKTFGCGAVRWLHSCRMKRARVLLENPYYTVSEVAARCGFQTANYFIRAFRKVHGMTPGTYRRTSRPTTE